VQPVICLSAMLLFFTLGLAGCATDPNPARGGFIDGLAGLSSGSYQDRVNQREQDLAEMRDNSARLEARNRELQEDLAESKATEDSYRAQLAQLQGELTGLETRLRKAKVRNQAQAARKKELEVKLASLKGRTQTFRTQSTGSHDAAVQAELTRMKTEKEVLKQQIIKLGAQ